MRPALQRGRSRVRHAALLLAFLLLLPGGRLLAAGPPEAGPCPTPPPGGLELLRLDAATDFPGWMEREDWNDERPFSRSSRRFRLEGGLLRLESAGDSFLIGRSLRPQERRPVAGWPYLRFVVRVDRVPRGARLAGEERDDSAFRLYAVFDESPLQALVYVWSWELPVGAWSARGRSLWGDFRRVRRKAFGQGEPPAGQWLTVEVNLARDFAAQFPGAPPSVLGGLALKADSNNTPGASSLAWLCSVSLASASLADRGLKDGDPLGETRLWFR